MKHLYGLALTTLCTITFLFNGCGPADTQEQETECDPGFLRSLQCGTTINRGFYTQVCMEDTWVSKSVCMDEQGNQIPGSGPNIYGEPCEPEALRAMPCEEDGFQKQRCNAEQKWRSEGSCVHAPNGGSYHFVPGDPLENYDDLMCDEQLMLLNGSCTQHVDADDEQNACAKALEALPMAFQGKVVMLIEGWNGMDLTFNYALWREDATADGCTVNVATYQDGNLLCGSEFKGALHYNIDHDRWEGKLVEFDRGMEVRNGQQMTVDMQLRPDGRYGFNGVFTHGTAFCVGGEISGNLTAADDAICNADEVLVHGVCHPKNTTDQCDEGQILVDGVCKIPKAEIVPFCKEPENKDAFECQYAKELRDTAYAYISGLSIPTSQKDCCTDFNADGELDNKLAELVSKLGGTIKQVFGDDFYLDKTLTDIFENGSLNLIVALDNLPAEEGLMAPASFDMKLYIAELDKDGGDWMKGEGDFTLDGDAIVSANGFVRRGVLTVQANKFLLPIPGDVFGEFFGDDAKDILGDGIALNLSNVELVVVADDDDGGLSIASTEDTRNDKGNPINYLTGMINGPELAVLLNDILGGLCNASGPVVTIKDEQDPEGEKGQPIIEFNSDAITKDDETCNNIKGLDDTLATILPILFDLDSNGNGVKDSLSAGWNLRLSKVGSIAE